MKVEKYKKEVIPHKTMIESSLFVLVFVLPFVFVTLSPPSYNIYYQIAVVLCYFLYFIFKPTYLKEIVKSGEVLIVFAYAVGVAVKTVVYGHLNMHAMLMPLIALYGYHYIDNNRINLNVFDILLPSLYIYFYYTYYIHLPSLFYRVGFDDGDWFGTSSSNAIPIVLINILYIYEVLSYLQKESIHRRNRLFIFSTINLVLILIQQSRVGIVMAALFFVWNLFNWSYYSKKKIAKIVPVLLLFFVIYVFYQYGSIIIDVSDSVGDVSSEAYKEDVRSQALNSFYDNMGVKEFLFGYPNETEYADNIKYTFNLFADHWNKYTIIGLVVLLFVLVKRIFAYKKYYFPLYYLLPFLLYGYVEPRYLPEYWDFFIYLMLFKKLNIDVIKKDSKSVVLN